jgi:hypothetical protein
MRPSATAPGLLAALAVTAVVPFTAIPDQLVAVPGDLRRDQHSMESSRLIARSGGFDRHDPLKIHTYNKTGCLPASIRHRTRMLRLSPCRAMPHDPRPMSRTIDGATQASPTMNLR